MGVSQVRHLHDDHGMSSRPFGRRPVPGIRLVGSFITGIAALVNARHTSRH